jgi:hypothetical protein
MVKEFKSFPFNLLQGYQYSIEIIFIFGCSVNLQLAIFMLMIFQEEPADYRQPVMTFLFLKRIPDTFEELTENLIHADNNEKSYVKEELVLQVRRLVIETKQLRKKKSERLADSSGKCIELKQ